MPGFSVPQGRRSRRAVAKTPASLVIHLDRTPKRLPCLVIDSSKEGFRLRGSFDLGRGQVVELILDEDMPSPERCKVVWVGKAGSKRGGELGLETLQAIAGSLASVICLHLPTCRSKWLWRSGFQACRIDQPLREWRNWQTRKT
jgi:hypothetical protein